MRNQFRDKVLFIVKNASKTGQKFLTIVDMKALAFDFADLDKYILTALLQCKQPEQNNITFLFENEK